MSNHITSEEYQSIKQAAAREVPGAVLEVVAFPSDLMDFQPPKSWRMYEYRNNHISQLRPDNWYNLTLKTTVSLLKGRLLIETTQESGKRVLHVVK